MLKRLSIIFGFFLLATMGLAQYGNPEYRAKGYLHTNRVRTVFYNYGLMGNLGELSLEWPIGTGNEYAGDISPLLAVEFIHPSGDTLHSVITSDGPRGNSDGPPGGGVFWGFEPVPGYAKWPPPGPQPVVATSDRPETWPNEWNGQWYGADGMGTIWGDIEAYYQVDDHCDTEWRSRGDSTLHPFPEDTVRGGVGLRMEVRLLEFDRLELRDAIIVMYIIHNDGTVMINRARFGFVAGTLAGGRMDSGDDISLCDTTLEMAYTYDGDDNGSPGWVPVNADHNVGYFGTVLVKTPDDKGLTAFGVFSPPGAVRLNYDEGLWDRMTPGLFSELPIPSDCDYIMSTGDFTLLPGTSDTIVAAFVFGADHDDLNLNATTLIQQYNSGEMMSADERWPVSTPASWVLYPAAPNPFNSMTMLSFQLSKAVSTRIDVFDIAGRSVMSTDYGILNSGTHRMIFDGRELSSGIYLYRVTAGESARSGKLILLK